MTHWVVCGGGMRGIVASALLRGQGHDVSLLERQSELGGILLSTEWDGLFVDKGCHLLDLLHKGSAQFYHAVMGSGMHPVHRKYSSINAEFRSDDIALPDISCFPEMFRQEALEGLFQAVQGDAAGHAGSLEELLHLRFGSTAGTYAATCARKMTGIDPGRVDADAFVSLPLLHRIRYAPDVQALPLKLNPRIDERTAVSSFSLPNSSEAVALGRNQYPSEKGMRGFCEAAHRYLEALGVRLHLGASITNLVRNDGHVTIELGDGTSVTSERVYWSGPAGIFLQTTGQEDPAAKQGIPARLLIYAFRVPPDVVNDVTYIHDYRPETKVFRFSTAGVYGRQIAADGSTYVLAEVPVGEDETAWRNPLDLADQIWAETVDVGLVSDSAVHRGVRADALPAAYVLPAVGSAEHRHRRTSMLAGLRPEIAFPNEGVFGKSSIFDSVTADLNIAESGLA